MRKVARRREAIKTALADELSGGSVTPRAQSMSSAPRVHGRAKCEQAAPPSQVEAADHRSQARRPDVELVPVFNRCRLTLRSSHIDRHDEIDDGIVAIHERRRRAAVAQLRERGVGVRVVGPPDADFAPRDPGV